MTKLNSSQVCDCEIAESTIYQTKDIYMKIRSRHSGCAFGDDAFKWEGVRERVEKSDRYRDS